MGPSPNKTDFPVPGEGGSPLGGPVGGHRGNGVVVGEELFVGNKGGGVGDWLVFEDFNGYLVLFLHFCLGFLEIGLVEHVELVRSS